MKRFEIITETDARMLDVGSSVELAAGGLVTPLAQDTLSGAPRDCGRSWSPGPEAAGRPGARS